MTVYLVFDEEKIRKEIKKVKENIKNIKNERQLEAFKRRLKVIYKQLENSDIRYFEPDAYADLLKELNKISFGLSLKESEFYLDISSIVR